VPAITWATAPAVGGAITHILTDASLPYPEALGTLADRAETVTLTDAGSNIGALLQASSGFTDDLISLGAGGATGYLKLNQEGHMVVGTGFPSDTLVMNFTLNETHNAPGGFVGIQGNAGNFGTGFTRGGNFTASPAGASALTATGVINAVTVFSGSFTGDIICSDSQPWQGLGGVLTNVTCFKGSPISSAFGSVTNFRHFWGNGDPTSASPTNAFGVDIDLFTTATNRWGGRFGNKVECTGSDFIASTNGKGYIMKDAQGTPHFWRLQVDATDGIPYVEDIGTTAPTT
jgi:hypothetical protein